MSKTLDIFWDTLLKVGANEVTLSTVTDMQISKKLLLGFSVRGFGKLQQEWLYFNSTVFHSDKTYNLALINIQTTNSFFTFCKQEWAWGHNSVGLASIGTGVGGTLVPLKPSYLWMVLEMTFDLGCIKHPGIVSGPWPLGNNVSEPENVWNV